MAAESPRIALVLGGARSGKSAFAERLASGFGEPILFVATGTAIDPEMRDRIEAHRSSRPESWQAVEAPLGVGQAVRERAETIRTALLDCLTLLVSNCLVGPQHDRLPEHPSPAPLPSGRGFGEGAEVAGVAEAVECEVRDLLDATRVGGLNLVVVSNEVGMGVVPPYPIGRVYRDLLGRANQQLAAAADAVYLMVAGVPLEVKRGAR